MPCDIIIANMTRIVAPQSLEASGIYSDRYLDKVKYRVSAATAAIHFLGHASREVRMQMRKTIVIEDHIAVGWSECHAQGLIPFCQRTATCVLSERWVFGAMPSRPMLTLYTTLGRPRYGYWDCA